MSKPSQIPGAVRRVYFCNIDFGMQLTGIEHATIRRAELFVRQLGVVPVMLTSKLNLDIRENWLRLQQLGLVDEAVPLRNVYEEVMQTESGMGLPASAVSWPAHYRAADRADGQHQRVEDDTGVLHMYVVWRSRERKRLNYINYFRQGKFAQRDKFNRYGQLAVSQELNDKNQVLSETCFTPQGRRCLFRRLEAETGAVQEVRRFDAAGLLQDIYASEEDLVAWWLQQTMLDSDQVFLVERQRQWLAPLCKLAAQRPQRLISIVHANHLQRQQDDSLTGPLNRHYSEVLDGTLPVQTCVVLTSQQASDIAQRFTSSRFDLVTIPHALAAPVVQVPFTQRNPDLLVTLARLAPEKRLGDMLRIMRQLLEHLPGKTLHIYGDGGERKSLEALIEEYGLQGKVVLKGYIDDIAGVLDKAGFYLSTSKTEGFGMAMQESLAHGCPVLAYDVRYGPASLIRHEENGLLISDGDVDAAVQALVSVYTRPGGLAQMSARAYDLAQAYQPERLAPAWQALIAPD